MHQGFFLHSIMLPFVNYVSMFLPIFDQLNTLVSIFIEWGLVTMTIVSILLTNEVSKDSYREACP